MSPKKELKNEGRPRSLSKESIFEELEQEKRSKAKIKRLDPLGPFVGELPRYGARKTWKWKMFLTIAR